MITKICLNCGKEFITYPSRSRKYCSYKCYWKSLKSNIPWITGKHHSKETIEKLKKSHLGQVPWNKGKKLPQFSGKNHPNWKGGIHHDPDGYIWLLEKDHLKSNKYGYIRRSRLIVGKCLGRYLTKKEVVHHINGIRDDDRPENLYLFSFQSKHRRFHCLKNKPNLISNLMITI